jgi:hypothetical protein
MNEKNECGNLTFQAIIEELKLDLFYLDFESKPEVVMPQTNENIAALNMLKYTKPADC